MIYLLRTDTESSWTGNENHDWKLFDTDKERQEYKDNEIKENIKRDKDPNSSSLYMYHHETTSKEIANYSFEQFTSLTMGDLSKLLKEL